MSDSRKPEEAWVTIAVFGLLHEAEILKSYLESGGVEAFIPEQHISTINPMAAGIQVRVQVRSSSEEDARKLLQEFQPPKEKPKCPRCGSAELKITPVGIKGWLQFVIGALIMVPMNGSHRTTCTKCRVEHS